MGTRGLVIMKKNKKYCLAIYNHWDSYPSDLGYKIVKFLRNLDDIEEFKKKMDFVKMVPKKDLHRYSNVCKSISSIEILENILETDGKIITEDYLFYINCFDCEWAYVIDFDINSFEIYKGYNEEPLTPNDRFYNKNETLDNGYYPAKLIIKYDLNNLPMPEELKESDYIDNITKKDFKLTKKKNNKPRWMIYYKCNHCERESERKENYCPSCGCKMK